MDNEHRPSGVRQPKSSVRKRGAFPITLADEERVHGSGNDSTKDVSGVHAVFLRNREAFRPTQRSKSPAASGW
jgi:hypothetical protein